MAEVDIQTVRKIAALARLALREEEAVVLAQQFARTLEHFRALSALDVSAVEAPLAGGRTEAGGDGGLQREDRPGPCLPPDEILANAPARVGDFYSVPKTIGAEE